MPYTQALANGLKPDPILTVSQWADKYRYLSTKASAEPGKYRTDRTPYLREPMDALSHMSTIREVIFKKGSQVGAPLALDTKVPTTDGVKTMESIEVDDFVYGSDGWPVKVIGKSEVFKDQDCYEVTFDSGEVIKCDSRHLWTLEKSNLKGKFQTVTISTDTLLDTYKKRDRNVYRLPNIKPMISCEADLPIDPYTLGVWLGDGHRSQNRICAGAHDSDEIAGYIPYRTKVESEHRSVKNILIDPRDEVYCVRGHRFDVTGKNKHGRCSECHRIRSNGGQLPDRKPSFYEKIKENNLLKNKHIPEKYLYSSLYQRIALLQGLMDTDGYCSKDGLCEFSNTNENISRGLFFILGSLGFKPRFKVKKPRSDNRKELFIVRFTAYASDPVFRLVRKKGRLNNSGRIFDTKYRRISKVEKLDKKIDTVCIKVATADSLFAITDSFILTHNTEMGNNWIGYVMDYAPGPMLVVQPTVEMAKKFSKQRLEPLVDETPRIKEKIATKKSKDSDNTLMSKSFPGGTLFLTGANSSAGLASMPAKDLMLDEVDRYPADVNGEGDPSKLAKKRQATFSRRKTLEISTPTEDTTSRITASFETTDKRYYYIPCPHCDHAQTLVWEQVRWKNDSHVGAWYECIECEEKIEEWQKTKMLEKGEWVATAEAIDPKVRGYHLNALYSPVGWYSWADCVKDYLEALGDQKLMKVFVNTVQGLSFKDMLEQPDYKRLWERSRSPSYKFGTVPRETCFLTAGVDLQRDRIELEIVGWAKNHVSYSIDYIVLDGSTDQPQVWAQLFDVLNRVYPCQDDPTRGYKIAKTAIDTGFNTQTAYNWIRKTKTLKLMAIKGRDERDTAVSIPKPVDIKIKGRGVIKRGLNLSILGVNMLKEELYGWLVSDVPGENDPIPRGYCNFLPYGEEYFKMLTAEAVETSIVGAKEVRKWKKLYDRNEALDCRIYARAASISLGSDRFRDSNWDSMKTKTHFIKKEDQGAKETAKEIKSSPEKETVIKTEIPLQKKSKKRKRSVSSFL